MTWSTLVPVLPAKSAGRPMASASLRVTKKGVSVLLFLSSFVVDKWAHNRADVQIGSGEHAGMIRIAPAEDGAYVVGKGPRGSARITLPGWEGLPQGATQTEPCGLIEDTAEALVVRLPVAEWEIAVSRANAPSGGAEKQERYPSTPSGSPSPSSIGRREQAEPAESGSGPVRFEPVRVEPVRVDLIAFLQPKGFKCSRMADGKLMLDGEVVQAGTLLTKVNDIRRVGRLRPLKLDEVF